MQLDIPGTPYAEMLALAQELEASLLEMIRRRRSESARGPDLLSAIVRAVDAEGGISERNLVGQSVVMFLAAHETTAYALVWTLFLLSQHPELAVRLSHELRNTLGGAPPKDNEVALLGHVIQESLRLFPVVPYTVRVAMRPARLPGLDVPRHTRILIPFDVAHRRAESFPRPQAFAPERWQSLEPPPYTYMPFGAGLHMCVGASFATRTLEIVLSMLLQRFQPVPAAGARIDRRVTVTIAPRRGLPMTLLEAGRPFERAPVRGDVHDMVDLSGGGE
ncbi:MAG: cytochrome P450 [Proteobacteria bacterium]|nr:cytochrome P450 [Pseudomonadota bacterium]